MHSPLRRSSKREEHPEAGGVPLRRRSCVSRVLLLCHIPGRSAVARNALQAMQLLKRTCPDPGKGTYKLLAICTSESYLFEAPRRPRRQTEGGRRRDRGVGRAQRLLICGAGGAFDPENRCSPTMVRDRTSQARVNIPAISVDAG